MKSQEFDVNTLNSEIGEASSNNNSTIIQTAIEISKRSGVPMLFLSNPGAGKTSIINTYAEANGYHVESLILSQYSQDEILGFQANTGKDHLEILEPEWFHRIWVKKNEENKPSILFLDELSTVDGPRQGAGLQLCFERAIRGGKKLPEDCIVLSAANYKQNLPGYTDIISPTLNRFDIINLLPGDIDSDIYSISFEVLKEATKSFKTPAIKPLEFRTDYVLSEDEERDFLKLSQSNFSTLFGKYTKKADSERGFLDMRNTRYDGIFDREDGIPEVYNFISIRTLSYYNRVVKAMAEMGIDGNNTIFHKFVDGLIGLGTNNWTDDGYEALTAQLKAYHQATYSITASLLNKFAKRKIKKVVEKKPEAAKLESFDSDSVAGKIHNFAQAEMTNADGKDKFAGPQFITMMSAIWQDYKESEADVPVCLKKALEKENGLLKFRADYEAIQLLIGLIKEHSSVNSGLAFYNKKLQKTLDIYEYYYQSGAMDVQSDQL